MRVGRIEQVHDYPEANKPSYRLRIDFGPEIGVRQSVAALKADYGQDELVGRMVVAVANFAPKQVGKHMSEVLVLAAVGRDGKLQLLAPDMGAELGASIR